MTSPRADQSAVDPTIPAGSADPDHLGRIDLDDAVRSVVQFAATTGAAPAVVLRDLARDLASVLAPGRPALIEAIVHPLSALATSGVTVSAATTMSLPVDVLGRVHEALLDANHRHRVGAYYTPRDVAEGLVARALDAMAGTNFRVADPACGGGAFLLAAARHLESMASGAGRGEIVEELLWGVDIDPLAAAVTATTLRLWAAEAGDAVTRTNIVIADSLVDGRDGWPATPAGGFDAVVGNPPFQNQLDRSTARPSTTATILRDRFGSAAFRYTDTAALFLLEACRWTRRGGRVALVLPQSFLVTDDAAAVRRAVLELGSLRELWLADDRIFDAAVRVCAPVISIGGDDGPVRRSSGRSFVTAGVADLTSAELQAEPTWSVLTSELLGVPPVASASPSAGVLASFCTATAGFRDQFYGIVPFVREWEIGSDAAAGEVPANHLAPLLTSGLIEPARHLWNRRRTRFAGTSWSAPVVDLEALGAAEPALMRWTEQRLVPKLVVATQTRVLEAAVDEAGRWFPSVPTIAVVANHDRLWEAAAVVLAPATSAWAMRRHGGAALSGDALKLSASQLLEAPLPPDHGRWMEATVALRRAAAAPDEQRWRASLLSFGRTMGAAYGTDAAVLEWWFSRLPRWRLSDA